MKLPVSDKEQTPFVKPKIRKGYYPGKFVGYKVFADKDEKPIESKFFTHQLILDFEVWKADEKGEPLAELQYDYGNDKTDNVKLSFFVNYEVKKVDKATNEVTWESLITPKAKITKVFEAMGWVFDKTKELDLDEFVGQFVDLNVKDYSTKATSDKPSVTFSVIEDIDPLNPESEVAKDKKEKSLKEDKPAINPDEPVEYLDDKKAADLKQSLLNLKTLKDSGNLTEEGYKAAVESVNKELGALVK